LGERGFFLRVSLQFDGGARDAVVDFTVQARQALLRGSGYGPGFPAETASRCRTPEFGRVLVRIVNLVTAPFLDVGEKGFHLIKVLGRKRIVLVVVAFAAAHGRAEPRPRQGADAVGGVFGQVFLGLRAAFAGFHIEAVVAAGDFLFGGGMGQKVARDLLDGELVEGLVGVERVNHIITIRKIALDLVAVIAHRVGEPHRVQPRDGHAFAVMRRSQQAVHLPFVSLGAVVPQKRGRSPPASAAGPSGPGSGGAATCVYRPRATVRCGGLPAR
jgi:hypothetical protein